MTSQAAPGSFTCTDKNSACHRHPSPPGQRCRSPDGQVPHSQLQTSASQDGVLWARRGPHLRKGDRMLPLGQAGVAQRADWHTHTGRVWILSAVTFSQLTPSLATSAPRTHLSDSRPWTFSIRRLFPFAFSTASPSNLLCAERLLSPVVSAAFGCPPSFCPVSNSPRQTGCPPATQSRKLSNPPSRKGLAWLYHHQEGIKHLSLSR